MVEDLGWKKFQARMMRKQSRYNLILAMTTFILAISAVLQLLKLYDISTASWFYWLATIAIIIAIIISGSAVWDEFTGK